MAKADDDMDRVAREAAREATAKANQAQELNNLQTEVSLLEKAKKKTDQLLAKTREQYDIARSAPNVPQVAIAAVGAGAGVFVGYWLQEMIAGATDEWVDEETGEPTWGRWAAVHLSMPIAGIVGIAVGFFMRNGIFASGLIGLGSGLLFGSLLRSVMLDDPLAAPVDDEVAA